jgi:hypothetical protein
MLRKVESRIKVVVERKKEAGDRTDETKKEGKRNLYEKINMINLKYFPLS